MKRIYSNYTDEEYELVEKNANEMGLSLSAYQKYVTLLRLKRDNEHDLNDLINKMKDSLREWPIDKPFIVSSLLPEEWVSLNHSQKTSLAQILTTITNKSNEYEIVKRLSGNIKQYRKKK